MSPFDGLGSALRWLRYKRDLSQHDVASRSGLHKAQISKYERGRDSPSVKNLGKLLDALGVRLGDLETALEEVRLRDSAVHSKTVGQRAVGRAVTFIPPEGLEAEEQEKLADAARSFGEFLALVGRQAAQSRYDSSALASPDEDQEMGSAAVGHTRPDPRADHEPAG